MSLREYPSILWHDLRYGFRQFRGAPATAVIAIVSLAIGIGANTTIFSVVHTVLLATPAYKNADRLVVLWESNNAKGIARTPVAPATFLDWRNANHSFEDLQLVAPGSPVTVAGGLPERVNIQYATPGLFPLLGMQPIIGHAFTESDLDQSDPLVVSYGYWQRRFGANPAAVGQKIVVNGAVHTLAGVLPPDFHLFDETADIWLPVKAPDSGTNDHSFRSWLIAVGRLRPGVKLQAAQSEMDLMSAQIAQAHPDTNKDWGVRVEPIQQAQFGYWKPILGLLFGSVLFVLLICCANVANLLLGRLPARSREVAIRISLGASRGRLVLQLLHEGVLLGTVGGVIGLLLALWGVRLFVAFAPPNFPLLHTIAISQSVLFFFLPGNFAVQRPHLLCCASAAWLQSAGCRTIVRIDAQHCGTRPAQDQQRLRRRTTGDFASPAVRRCINAHQHVQASAYRYRISSRESADHADIPYRAQIR
jgi:putative ABC transport system permease protein